MLLACFLLAGGVSYGQPYVEDSIDVAGRAVGSLALNSRANVVYGGSQEAGIFFAISADSNKLVARWPLARPRDLCYDSTDNKCYVAHCGEWEDYLAVIDGNTHSYLRGIEMPGATMPVWDPVSNRVFVTSQTLNQVFVVDCSTDSIVARIPVGDCPIRAYLGRPGRKLYVMNSDEGSVSIVDIATNAVIRSVETGGDFDAGCYSSVADKFYCVGATSIVVVGGASDSVIGRIPFPLGSGVSTMTDVPTSGLMMFGVYGGGYSAVYSVDTQWDSVVSVVTVGRVASSLLSSPSRRLVYCAGTVTDDISVLADDGTRVNVVLSAGDCPFVMVEAPSVHRVYVGHLNTSRVYVIRDSTSPVSEGRNIAAGPGPALEARPAPFSSSVFVRSLPGVGHVVPLHVYAPSGTLVRTLAGRGVWHWDGRDDQGRPVPAGAYVLRIAGSAGSTVLVKVK